MSLRLLELSPPVSFEGCVGVTGVFWDSCLSQVVSVRSQGATGLTVKEVGGSTVLQCRLEGGQGQPVHSVKLSRAREILSLQREQGRVECISLQGGVGQVYSKEQEWGVSLRNGGTQARLLGFLWLPDLQLVLISETGLELHSVSLGQGGKVTSRYRGGSSTAVAWHTQAYTHTFIVTAPAQEAKSLQVWTVKGSSFVKVGNIELASALLEREVAVLELSSLTLLAVNRRREGNLLEAVQLYTITQDQVCWTHSLPVEGDLSGPVALQVLDNLLLVHNQSQGVSLVYDLALPSRPHPLHPSVALPSLLFTCCIPWEGAPSIGVGTGTPSYPPSWLILTPNIVIDARQGKLWTLRLKLGLLVPEQDNNNGGAVKPLPSSPPLLSLCQFLLGRSGGKVPSLSLLSSCVKAEAVTLPHLQEIFSTVASTRKGGNTPVVLDQADVFSHVFSPSVTLGVTITRLRAALLEYILALQQQEVTPRQFLLELLINLYVQVGEFYQLQQLIQYQVIRDSKQVSCLLLSLESAYPPARHLAIDMMARLGTATDEMIEIFLSEGKLISALNLVKAQGLVDTVSARKFLEAAERGGDKTVFFNVFSFFEERNLRLRGSGKFSRGEQCDSYVEKFKEMFLDD